MDYLEIIDNAISTTEGLIIQATYGIVESYVADKSKSLVPDWEPVIKTDVYLNQLANLKKQLTAFKLFRQEFEENYNKHAEAINRLIASTGDPL